MTLSQLHETLIQISRDQLRFSAAIDTSIKTEGAIIQTIEQMTRVMKAHENAIQLLLTTVSQPAVIGSN